MTGLSTVCSSMLMRCLVVQVSVQWVGAQGCEGFNGRVIVYLGDKSESVLSAIELRGRYSETPLNWNPFHWQTWHVVQNLLIPIYIYIAPLNPNPL